MPTGVSGAGAGINQNTIVIAIEITLFM
jgi:hypothetical protein